MEVIHLLHFSDLHIGMEKYGRMDPLAGINSRVLDFLARFDWLIEYGLEHEVDLVLFAGDAFKTRNPSPTHEHEFALRVKRLASAGVKVVILAGNHDIMATVRRASSISIFRTLEVPNVIVADSQKLHLIETRNGPVQVAAIPYPVRQRLIPPEESRKLSMEQLDKELVRIVTKSIDTMVAKLDPDIPAILTAHQSVSGAVSGSERSAMIGRDIALSFSTVFNPAWDYVALGHIHQHQDVAMGAYPSVVYAGSLDRIDFGEEGETKGFCWVNLACGKTTWEFVEVDARPFITIRVDLRDVSDPLEALQNHVASHDLRNAVVRAHLLINDDQELQLGNRAVRAVLGDAYFLGDINYEVNRKGRVRLGNLNPQELTEEELLLKYFKSKDMGGGRIEELMHVFADCVQGGSE